MPVAKEDRCQGVIYSDHYRYQCGRRGSTEHKGKKYCRTHNPFLMHQKQLVRDAKWTEQRIAGQDAERIRIENHQVGALLRENQEHLFITLLEGVRIQKEMRRDSKS